MATRVRIIPLIDAQVRDYLTPEFRAWWSELERRRPEWYPDLYWQFGRAMAALAYDAGRWEAQP